MRIKHLNTKISLKLAKKQHCRERQRLQHKNYPTENKTSGKNQTFFKKLDKITTKKNDYNGDRPGAPSYA